MPYQHIQVPPGVKIAIAGGKLRVPDRPIIPFIEGDGTGPDIWRASVRVLDAAVEKAYAGKRKIAWMEVLAGGRRISKKRISRWVRVAARFVVPRLLASPKNSGLSGAWVRLAL